MKNKKWLIIGIISIVLIGLEITAFFVVIKPYIYKNKMFNALDEGNGRAADDARDQIYGFVEKSVDDDLQDFLTFKTNSYLDGTTDYETVMKTMRAVESIKDYRDLTEPFTKYISLKELRSIYLKGYTQYVMSGSDDIYDIWNEFDNVYYISSDNEELLYEYSDETREDYRNYIDTELNNYLQEKYDEYKAGKIDVDAIKAYIQVADNFFKDMSLSSSLDDEIYYVTLFNDEINRLQEMMDSGEYYDAMTSADSDLYWYDGYPYYDDYKDKLQSIYDDAYEKGVAEALKEAEDYAAAGDKNAAESALRDLKQKYGDDIDTSNIEDMLIAGWAKAYSAFMADWSRNLSDIYKSGFELKTSSDGALVLDEDDYEYADIVPDRVYLYDFDGDETPEMVLENTETGISFVLGYANEKVQLILTAGLYGAGGDGNIAAWTEYLDEELDIDMTMYMLIRLEKTAATVDKYTIIVFSGDEAAYFVDSYDELSTEEDYREARSEIEDAAYGYLPTGYGIEDYQRAIDAY